MRKLLLLAALAIAAPAAHAQILSVYGTYSPAHFSNVETGTVVTGNTYTEQYASYWANGFGGGVTFGILPIGPIRIGLDVRGSTKPGTVGADTAFVGLRVAAKAPLIPVKPYLQVSGGYVATRTYTLGNISGGTVATPAGGTFTNKYAAFEVLGGIDYKLIHFVDLRLIEVGVGKGYDTGFSFNNTNTQGNLTLFTVDSGIVLHF